MSLDQVRRVVTLSVRAAGASNNPPDGEKRLLGLPLRHKHGWKRYTPNRSLYHVEWLSRYACCMVPAQESGWDPTRGIPPRGWHGAALTCLTVRECSPMAVNRKRVARWVNLTLPT